MGKIGVSGRTGTQCIGTIWDPFARRPQTQGEGFLGPMRRAESSRLLKLLQHRKHLNSARESGTTFRVQLEPGAVCLSR